MRQKPDFAPPTAGIPRLSPTGSEEYFECGVRYVKRRIERVKRSNTFLAIGKGIHEVSAIDGTRKQEGKILKPPEARDLAVATYDEETTANEVLESKAALDEGRDKVAAGGAYFATAVAPSLTQPVLIELPVLSRFEYQGKLVELNGVIDRVEGATKPAIHDVKTGKRKKKAEFAHASGQLTAYDQLYAAQFGTPPDQLIIEDLSYTKKKGWQHQRLVTDRTDEDRSSWWQRMFLAMEGIAKGIFLPAQEGHWRCQPKYCEFFETCPYVSSARRHRAIEEEE